MTIAAFNTVATMKIAPEIRKAQESINLPEVREIIRRLAQYNLGVYIPHMHRSDIDFAALPTDMVQLEENCHVRWIPRSQLTTMPQSVSVAWRWAHDGAVGDVECIATCSANADDGTHYKDHL